MTIAAENTDYSTFEYWESRYSSISETYDWFRDFDAILHELAAILPAKTACILNLGCGNSLFPLQMYRAGWQSLVNVDYSSSVIQYMQRIAPEQEWTVCDLFQMDQFYQSESFDCAIDKGTLDAFLTVKHDPWNPDSEIVDRITKYMLQVCNVLKPNGSFLHITFAQPHFRQRFFQIPEFDVKVHKLSGTNGTFEYFIYEAIKV